MAEGVTVVEDALAIEEDVGECKLARGDAGRCFSPLSSNSVRAKAVGVPAVENALAEEDVAECSLARGDVVGASAPYPANPCAKWRKKRVPSEVNMKALELHILV